MTSRQYEGATVFNARIVNMQHLWSPSTEYKGQPTQKPNYFASFIVPKTQAQWFSEPPLAGIAQACGKLYAVNPHILQWPVVDGDFPTPEGKTSEWAKGHWIFSGSSGNMPNIELAQAGGALVKLPNKAGVKSGDFVMCGVTAAVKKNDPRGVKLYLNAVVFTAPGEEIVFANSVSGAELMRMAQQQGLQVAGFAGAQGFALPQQAGAPGFPPPSNAFAPGQAGAFQPGNPATSTAPGQFGTAGNGTATFPSNPGQQFQSPPNFAPGGGPAPQASFAGQPFAGQPFAAPGGGPFPPR